MNVYVIYNEYDSEVLGVYNNFAMSDVYHEAESLVEKIVEDKWDDTYVPANIFMQPFHFDKYGNDLSMVYYKDKDVMIHMATIYNELAIEGDSNVS